jgi:hypothetical protein
MKRGKKHRGAKTVAPEDAALVPQPQVTEPPDPDRVNHGTEPGESYGERWTNKVHSTPDPSAERGRDTIDSGKHQEPTPFLRG